MTGAYFIGFAYYADLYVEASHTVGSDVAWATTTTHLALNAHYRLRMLYAESPVSKLDVTSAERYENLNAVLVELEAAQTEFMYGEGDEPSWFVHSHPRELPGFPGSIDEIPVNFDHTENIIFAQGSTCATLDHAALSHGIYNMIKYYLEYTYDVAAALASVDENDVESYIDDYPPMKFLDTVAYDCLPQGLQYFETFQHKPMTDVSALINGYVHITCTVLLGIGMAVLYWAMFKPLMISVEREVALTPSMLLMLPASVGVMVLVYLVNGCV